MCGDNLCILWDAYISDTERDFSFRFMFSLHIEICYFSKMFINFLVVVADFFAVSFYHVLQLFFVCVYKVHTSSKESLSFLNDIA